MELQTLTNIIYIQTALSLVVAVYAFIDWKLRDTITKWIGLYFLIGFISNLAGQIIYQTRSGSYLLNYSGAVYNVLAFLMSLVIYYHALGKRYEKIFKVTAVLFTVLAIINVLFIQKDNIDSNILFLIAILTIFLCVFYFYRLMIDLPVIHVHRMPMFWINSGFLIFWSGTLFLFAFTTYLTHVLKNDLIAYWAFHNSLNIVEHLLVIVGLIYSRMELKKRSHQQDFPEN